MEIIEYRKERRKPVSTFIYADQSGYGEFCEQYRKNGIKKDKERF